MMDEYKEESEAFRQAIENVVKEGVNDETYAAFDEAGKAFGEKFDAARKTEVKNCFCGNEIDNPTEQEISPSMYYFNRRTCSTLCHNLWILGRFEGTERPVGKGWWSIIDNLYDNIYELDPDCQIVQIKEKFGTLTFYADYTEPELPLGITDKEVSSIQWLLNDLGWDIRKQEDEEYRDENTEIWPDYTLERRKKDLDNLRTFMDKVRPIGALIRQAEDLSSTTCEWCGEPGEARSGGWVLTLCDGCESDRQAGKRPWDDAP